MTTENYELIENLALQDVAVLKEKGKTYGSSWRSRGGIGAFMMLARKWDRIENISGGLGYDIFQAIQGGNVGDILDDIRDLRRYLLLVEAHCMTQRPLCWATNAEGGGIPPSSPPRSFSDGREGGQAGPCDHINDR